MPSEHKAHQSPTRVSGGTLGFALVFSIFWIVLGSSIVETTLRHDFLSFYTGASLAGEGRFSELYDPAAQLRRERELVPATSELIPFIRPPFYAALLSPLSFLPLKTAFWSWLALHSTFLIGCWIWGTRHFGPDSLVFAALYLPTALGIAHGQDGVFMLLIVIGGYHLSESGREAKAGALLAVGLIKFHLLLLMPLAILIQKRWKMFWGFWAVAGVELLVSALAVGLPGLHRYVDLLRSDDLSHLSPSPELMINVYSLAVNLGVGAPALSAVLAALVVVLMVIAVRGAPPWRFWSAALLGSVLLPPHAFGYDAGMLLLPIWLVIFRSKGRAARGLAVLLATPVVFFLSFLDSPWPAAPALTILLLLAALAWENLDEIRSSDKEASSAAA